MVIYLLWIHTHTHRHTWLLDLIVTLFSSFWGNCYNGCTYLLLFGGSIYTVKIGKKRIKAFLLLESQFKLSAKQWDAFAYLWEWLKSNTGNIKCWWGEGTIETVFISAENANGTSTLEGNWAVSHNAKHTFIFYSSNCAPWYLSKGFEHLRLHKTCKGKLTLAKAWKQ